MAVLAQHLGKAPEVILQERLVEVNDFQYFSAFFYHKFQKISAYVALITDYYTSLN